MNRTVLCLILIVTTGLLFCVSNAPWGDPSQIMCFMVMQRGTAIGAWHDPMRSDMTGQTWLYPNATATAAGDGSYLFRIDLVPGADYNYLFFAHVVSPTPLAGYASGYIQAEPVPDHGSDAAFFATRSTVTPTAAANLLPGAVRYGATGDGARRFIRLPTDLPDGTTVYVYHNFASTPTGARIMDVQPGTGRVELWWQGGCGWWNDPTKVGADRYWSALDTLGGRMRIYVSTDAPAGPYSLLADLPWSVTYYLHLGVTNGSTYYYVFCSSDAYNRATNPAVLTAWANLARRTPPVTGDWNPGSPPIDPQATPRAPVPVYFKVQEIDMEKIKFGDIVWMTPIEVDARYWPWKMPGTIVWACPKLKEGT